MRYMKSLFLLAIVCLVLSACNSETKSTALPPDVPTSEPTAIPTQPPAPTPEPTLLPPQKPDPFAGLVYKDEQGLWRIGPDGQPVFLVDQPDGRLSPDGNRVVYSYWQGEGADDIWLLDLASGERHNLTQSPERVDGEPRWWPARPEVIVFGSTDTVGPGAGFPTIIQTDASEYQVLDQEVAGPFALSPDGQTIAYGCCGNQGRLYRWGQGGEVFDPALYGASIDKLYTPSWSPDGRYLAWIVGGDLGGDGRWQIGLAVFSLEQNSHQILHPYEPVGGAMVSFNLSWSPNGDWLAFDTWAESGEPANVWVTRPDGSDEFHLGSGFGPVWSPTGQWLVYSQSTESADAGVWAAQAETWEQHQILPHGYEPVQWLD